MITFHNTHLFTITPRIKVYFENLMAVYTVKNSLPFMQSKGLLQCLQWPVTGPSPEPNKSSCHSPNLFQICWKNQLLVPSCLSICLFKRKSTTCNRQLAMEKHNLQQTACYGKAQLATDSLLWNSTTCNRQLAATFYIWSFLRNLSHSNFDHESLCARSLLWVVYITEKAHCNFWDEAEDKVMTWAQQQICLISCYIPNDGHKRL